MAGLDLGGVLSIVSGSERVHPATLNRFTDRFARFNLRAHMIARRMVGGGNGLRGEPLLG